jgi:gamma-glutamyltranspeptidase/glutathione hydrolase
MVMGLIDFGMNIQDALAAPRVSFIEPNTIAVEENIGTAVIEGLQARGHTVRVVKGGGLTNAHGLTIEYGKDGRPARFWGASDPRGQGLAKGY